MNTYRTAEIAKIIGIHPNTVRLYEELMLIPKPERQSNGYRIFTDFHIEQFRLARLAFQIEVLQNGLRKKIVKMIKVSGGIPENTHFFKRKEVSEYLGISMDALRNWEMNGLLTVKRRQNGYRVYTDEDIQRLKIIRCLRCANYSLEAILRMLRQLSENPNIDIKKALDTPKEDTDIMTVCDKLISSLLNAENNADEILLRLQKMKLIFS